MKYYVRCRMAPGLYMLTERRWDPVSRKTVVRPFWVHRPEDATFWQSEDAAWEAFDRSGCGRRDDYEIQPL